MLLVLLVMREGIEDGKEEEEGGGGVSENVWSSLYSFIPILKPKLPVFTEYRMKRLNPWG